MRPSVTADRLAQLVEYRTTVREVVRTPAGPTSSSLNNLGESAAFVMTSASG